MSPPGFYLNAEHPEHQDQSSTHAIRRRGGRRPQDCHRREFAGSRLSRRDGDLDCGVRPKMVAVTCIMLRVPVSNAPPYLAEKVEAALLGQMSEIADQVCDGMLVTSAAVPLKNCDRVGGPGDVVSFVDHASPQVDNRSTMMLS